MAILVLQEPCMRESDFGIVLVQLCSITVIIRFCLRDTLSSDRQFIHAIVRIWLTFERKSMQIVAWYMSRPLICKQNCSSRSYLLVLKLDIIVDEIDESFIV